MLLNVQILVGQEKEKYPSSEQNKYYESINHDDFTPISKEIVEQHLPSYLMVKKSVNMSNSFISIFEETLYQKVYDELSDSCDIIMDETNTMDSYRKCINYIDSMEYAHSYGDIAKSQILRVNSKSNPTIIFYGDTKFEHESWGYWIGLLENSKWNYYYTGLTANHYFYIKPTNTIGLVKDENSIQIEAALVRKSSSASMPL